MDAPISLNNCGGGTENTVDPTHDSTKTDDPDQKSKQYDGNVKDVEIPDTSVPQDETVDRSCQRLNKESDNQNENTNHNPQINVEQKELVMQIQKSPKITNDENSPEEISDHCKLGQVPGNASGSNKNEEIPTVADQIITEEPSKIMIDEQLPKPSQDVVLDLPITSMKIEKEASSLALLAQYDTENDSDDDVREVPVAQTYQNRCVEIDSDSSTSDVEFLSENRSSINLDMFDIDNEIGDDDEEEDGNIRTSRQPKVKGELQLEDLPPIEDLHITVAEEECTELGKVHSIVEQLVLVNALSGTVPLDLETVLFRDKGKQVLGEVFDVLGQVSDPLYCVRFNSNKEIKEKGIEVGQNVYVAPRTEHTQFVVLANLMKVRGSDASWENDVEPPPRFIDYSDDEEERSARRPNRKRQSSGGVTYAGRGTYTPRRPYRGNYSGRGGVRQPHHQTQGNYNIVGNSWHSNFYQPPMYNQPQYQMQGHSPSGYSRPNFNNTPYQQASSVNTGMVINPYALYPPPQGMQHPLFPPPHLQQPPPPQ